MSQTKTAPLPKSHSRKVNWMGFFPLLLGGLILLFMTLFLSRNPHIHPVLLFGDLMDFIDPQFQQPYIGLFSQVGLIFWFSAASVCGLAAFVNWGKDRLPKRRVQYLAAVALISAYLGLDDMLMFHERLFPVYLHLSEKVTLVIYGVVLLAVFLYFWREVGSQQFIFFLIFVGLIALTSAVDVLRTDDQRDMAMMLPSATLLEEGSKFLSLIALWTYCLFLSHEALMDSFKSVKRSG